MATSQQTHTSLILISGAVAMLLAVSSIASQSKQQLKEHRQDIIDGQPIKETYDVKGKTQDEVVANAKKNAPHPEGHIANTRWNFVDNETLGATIRNARKCHDREHTVIVNYEPSNVGLLVIVILPNWSNRPGGPDGSWWPRFLLELDVHEEGHVTIAQTGHEYAHKSHLLLLGMATADSLKEAQAAAIKDLRTQKDELLKMYLKQTQTYQDEYDKRTRHGQKADFHKDQKVAAETVEKMKAEFEETVRELKARAAATQKKFDAIKDGNCDIEHAKEDLDPGNEKERREEQEEAERREKQDR